MPIPPAKERLFPRHGCVFCRSSIHRRYNFNTHLDSHLIDVTNNSNNIAAADVGNHFIPVIAAVRRSSQRHIEGIPALRRSNFDGCHSWKLFTLIHTERELQAFKSRKLHTVGQWRAEAKRFLLLPGQTDAPDSFVPFEHDPVVGASSSSSDHESDYEPAERAAAPVYADSIHQAFGRSRGAKIVFNNLAQADNVGASLGGLSALNRNRYGAAESSRHQHRHRQVEPESSASAANRAYQQQRPDVKHEAESSAAAANRAYHNHPAVKSEADSSSSTANRTYDYPPAVKPEAESSASTSSRSSQPRAAVTPEAEPPRGYDLTPPRRPAPIETIDLRTPDTKRDPDFPTVLVLRGVSGSVIVPGGMGLQDALALVSEKIGERVLHLRDGRGVVGEERWRGRPAGEWRVAVEWGW